MARIVTAVVASVSPLTLAFPGDASGVHPDAVNTSGLSLAVGDKVRVEVRSPQWPKVLGRIS